VGVEEGRGEAEDEEVVEKAAAVVVLAVGVATRGCLRRLPRPRSFLRCALQPRRTWGPTLKNGRSAKNSVYGA